MGKQEGKKLTNNNKARTKEGSPKTKEKEPPQAPPEEGMWEETVGYGWLNKSWEGTSPRPSEAGDVPGGIRNAGGWGDGSMKKSGLKDVCLFLMGKDLELKKYALSHLICLLANPQEAVFVGFNIVVE